MELLLSLSKETNNSVAELLKMPSHFVLGMYNALRRILKKEAEAREKAEKKAQAEQNQMSSFRMPSMPSIPSISIPHV